MAFDLWKHQREMVDFASPRRDVIFDVCMGGGKTAAAIDTVFNQWESRLVLVLAPKSVVGSVWPKEIGAYCGDLVTVEPLRQNGVKNRIKALKMAGRMWKEGGGRRPLAFVMNYESLLNEEMLKLLLSIPWCACVADELHRLKGPKAKTSKAAARVFAKAKRRLGLTGTLLPHSPIDLFAQMRAISPEVFGKSFYRFRNRYGVLGGFQGKAVVGFRDTDDMMARCSEVITRFTEEDVDLHLPPQRDEFIELDMCAKAMKAYREVEADSIAQVQSGVITAANGLVKLLRLMQIASGVAVTEELDELGEVVGRTEEIVDTAKQDYLADVFEGAPTKPVVVFCRFRAELAAVHAAAEKAGVGSLELSGSRDELAEWQAGGHPVLAVQLGAGAEGVNLTRASHCVFMSTGLSLGVIRQARKRTHRPGQKKPTLHTYLISRGTVDQTLIKALASREEFLEHVLNYLRDKCPSSV